MNTTSIMLFVMNLLCNTAGINGVTTNATIIASFADGPSILRFSVTNRTKSDLIISYEQTPFNIHEYSRDNPLVSIRTVAGDIVKNQKLLKPSCSISWHQRVDRMLGNFAAGDQKILVNAVFQYSIAESTKTYQYDKVHILSLPQVDTGIANLRAFSSYCVNQLRSRHDDASLDPVWWLSGISNPQFLPVILDCMVADPQQSNLDHWLEIITYLRLPKHELSDLLAQSISHRGDPCYRLFCLWGKSFLPRPSQEAVDLLTESSDRWVKLLSTITFWPSSIDNQLKLQIDAITEEINISKHNEICDNLILLDSDIYSHRVHAVKQLRSFHEYAEYSLRVFLLQKPSLNSYELVSSLLVDLENDMFTRSILAIKAIWALDTCVSYQCVAMFAKDDQSCVISKFATTLLCD